MPPIHETLDWPEVPGLNQQQIICLGRCSNSEQFWGIARAFYDGQCPFCNHEYLSGEIVHQTEHWTVLQPPGSYNRHQAKLARKLIVFLNEPFGAKRHCEVVPKAAMASFGEILLWIDPTQDPGSCLYLRVGDARYNAGTVPDHLHWNYDAPSGTGEVRPPIYKDKAGWEKDLGRFNGFHQHYQHRMPLDEFIEACKGPGE